MGGMARHAALHPRTSEAIVLPLAGWAILFAAGALPLAAVGGGFAPARAEDRAPAPPGKLDAIEKSLVIDGSRVQYAGNLQMNVTNFGFLGSMPASRMPMSDSPSAQWPAGSGIEYLYAAGIWIGAETDRRPVRLDGISRNRALSAGRSDRRHLPQRARGRRGAGTTRGRADDDGDGRVNEDWLNGRDDDGDGRIDEDFAAIGNLMYSCRYSDDRGGREAGLARALPLGIEVRQETFQWSEKQLYNFIGVHYSVTNHRRRHPGEYLRGHIRRSRRGAERTSATISGTT